MQLPTGAVFGGELMLSKALRFAKNLANIYSDNSLTTASAALSYYFTMTFFPLVICLYTMLGNSYDKAVRILRFFDKFMSEELANLLYDFLGYVSANNNIAMMIAGLVVLVTSASAAMRSLSITIGRMQGGRKLKGLMFYVFSIVFALVLLAAIYFAMLVMLTGRSFIKFVNELLPFIDISRSWNWIRFLVMGGLFFVLIWGVFESVKRNDDEYTTFPGTAVTTVALVVVSLVFSFFISNSVKYSLVYGSLASLILLMFWLFACCNVIYIGAAINIALRDTKRQLENGAPPLALKDMIKINKK